MLQDAVNDFGGHTSSRVFAPAELQLPRGDRQTAALHRAWLRDLPRLTGMPLTRLAHRIKIAPSTLTRPLTEGDDGTSTLHANTIAKVVAHTGAAPPGGATTGTSRLGFGEDAAPYSVEPGDPLEAAIQALSAGAAAVAPWLLATRVVELAGFLPGDLLLLDPSNLHPATGDLVAAQVHDWQHHRQATVVRLFERAPPVELLVTRSLEQAPPLVVDGERIVIKGTFLPHRLRPKTLA
jgi:hypothetical protein